MLLRPRSVTGSGSEPLSRRFLRVPKMVEVVVVVPMNEWPAFGMKQEQHVRR